MMPSRATIEAAAPRCLERRIVTQTGLPSIPKQIVCYGPMGYQARSNRWLCLTCTRPTSGTAVAARRTVITETRAA